MPSGMVLCECFQGFKHCSIFHFQGSVCCSLLFSSSAATRLSYHTVRSLSTTFFNFFKSFFWLVAVPNIRKGCNFIFPVCLAALAAELWYITTTGSVCQYICLIFLNNFSRFFQSTKYGIFSNFLLYLAVLKLPLIPFPCGNWCNYRNSRYNYIKSSFLKYLQTSN